MSFEELLEEWRDHNHVHSFEGDSGLAKLEKLFEALGYEAHGFRYGSVIEAFLSDNSGACEVIVDWIARQNNTEWHDNVESELPERNEDDDEF